MIATLDDIAAANRLAHETLGRCLDEMPPQTRRLLALIEHEVAARCAGKKMERADVRFTRRQVREATGWSHTQLHVHLSRLLDLEYVIAHRADHGHGFVYELVYDGSGKDGRPFVCGLLDVEKLRRAGNDGAQDGSGTLPPHDYDAQRSGSAEPDSGSVRPSFGPSSGPVPTGKNAESPSEKSPDGAPPSENTRPRTGAENAVAVVAARS